MTATPGAVLVTGGTGFLGSTLVRHLVGRGHDVHVLGRAPFAAKHLHDLPLTWHQGDLLDEDSIHGALAAFTGAARAADRVPQVVHGAALISYRTPDGELSRRINVEGTRLVLEACVSTGVERACYVSSVVAVGHARDARSVLDEDASFNGAALRTHYVTTKRAAEDFALAAGRQLETVVVNPGAIFGPAPAGSNTNRFLRRLARGTFKLAPPGSLSVVGVNDVAEGIRLALEKGRPGCRYLLTESNWTHLELMRLAARFMGIRGPRGKVPGALWRLLVLGASGVDRFSTVEEATPQALRLLGLHFRFDSSRARTELGWSPRPFEEVLRATIEHLSFLDAP